MQVVNEMFNSSLNVDKLLEMLSKSKEFEQIKVSMLSHSQSPHYL